MDDNSVSSHHEQNSSDVEQSAGNSFLHSIKKTFRSSPFANCTREAFLWGIATGTAMGIHRYRMGSSLKRVSNFTFGTTLLVAIPSYYMCCKTKIWNKKVIEEMMAANQFEHESDAPSQPALEDHPFLTKVAEGEESLDKEFAVFKKPEKYPVAATPEKK